MAGRGVAEALDQGLDVSLQLLGEDHLLDALLHLVPTRFPPVPTIPRAPPVEPVKGAHRWTVEGTAPRAPWSRSAWAWRTRRAGAQSKVRRLKSLGTTSPPADADGSGVQWIYHGGCFKKPRIYPWENHGNSYGIYIYISLHIMIGQLAISDVYPLMMIFD